MSGQLVMRLLGSLATLVVVSNAAILTLPVVEEVLPSPTSAASEGVTGPLLGTPSLTFGSGVLPSPTTSGEPSSTSARDTPRPLPTATPAPVRPPPTSIAATPQPPLPTIPPIPPLPTLPPLPVAPPTTCSNGVDNSGGLGLICEVTVVNTITAVGGSATVTVRECHGAAGDPEAACSTKTVRTGPVTAVNQCNGSINGGGGTLRCSVRVTTIFVGVNPGVKPLTVNQCIGSGGGITFGCVPLLPTAGAAIRQCNGSANGGTLVGLTCTATGMASALPVKINQCNQSANGGGSLVICTAQITSRVE